MTKREKLIGIFTLIFFVIFLLFYIIPHFLNKDNHKNIILKESKITDNKKNSTIINYINKNELIKISNRIDVLKQDIENNVVKDPFKKPIPDIEKPQTNLSDLKFLGIMWHKGEPFAIINEKLYKQGNTILGFKIVQIKTNEIILSKNGQMHLLRLFPEYSIKKTLDNEDINNEKDHTNH